MSSALPSPDKTASGPRISLIGNHSIYRQSIFVNVVLFERRRCALRVSRAAIAGLGLLPVVKTIKTLGAFPLGWWRLMVANVEPGGWCSGINDLSGLGYWLLC